MSDRSKKTEAYACSECGELYDHPSLAGKCSRKCELFRLHREIAELRCEQGKHDADHAHPKLELESMIADLRAVKEELEQKS